MIWSLSFPIQTVVVAFRDDQESYQPEQEEDDLHPTDDGKASEESHGASNETQLGLRPNLLVSPIVVKGGRVEVDLH